MVINRLLSLLEEKLSILPDKSEENPFNTLSALWLLACGHHVSPILAEKKELPDILPQQIILLEEFINQRLSGIPLAHLTERQNFLGLDYILKKGLYIPRKETELLANTAIDLIKTEHSGQQEVNVIDLCTGIGTVALAIAHYCLNSRVFGSDIYSPAIEAANINVKHFGLENRAKFFNADLFDPFEKQHLKNKTTIIVSAPPYISSAKVVNMAEEISIHEPKEAFDAGPFGLSVFSKLITTSPEFLTDHGYLIFECGLGQGEFLTKRIRANHHYGEITEVLDENGNIRVLKARISKPN